MRQSTCSVIFQHLKAIVKVIQYHSCVSVIIVFATGAYEQIDGADSIWTSICFPQGQVALHSHLLNGQAIKHVVCQLSQGQTEIQGFS